MTALAERLVAAFDRQEFRAGDAAGIASEAQLRQLVAAGQIALQPDPYGGGAVFSNQIPQEPWK